LLHGQSKKEGVPIEKEKKKPQTRWRTWEGEEKNEP